MPDRLSDVAFRMIVEEAPDAIVIVDGAGLISYVNTQAELLFGYSRERLLDQRVEVLVPEDRRSMHIIQREVYQEQPEKRPMGIGLDLVALRSDGTTFPVSISLSPFVEGDEHMTIASIRDVARRQREEETLRRSEARHRLLNERAENVIFRYQLLPRRRFEYVSAAVNARLGHAPEEFYVDDDLIFRLAHTDDRHVIEQALSSTAPRAVSARFAIRDEIRWFEFSIVPIKSTEGVVVALEGIGRDVTERRAADEERLHLQTEVEMQLERNRIAGDLHDDTIQSLYALGLRLEATRDDGSIGKDAAIDRATEGLEAIIGGLRELLHHLDGGGDGDDREQGRSLQSRLAGLLDSHGPTAWDIQVDSQLDIEPDAERQIHLLARELVSNVQRHAQASSAELSLARNGTGRIELSVRDDGIGFDRGGIGDDCFGLRSIEMRAAMLGAELELDSVSERGTHVRIILPERAQSTPTPPPNS